MSTQVTLKAEKREERGKGPARRLRADGRVPGVVYGKEADTIALSVDAVDAEYLFRSISTDNTIVDLDLEGEKASIPTLVREIQAHPFKDTLVHIDFYRIQEGVKVDVDIPVHLNGVPDGVKNSGGILQQVIHELPVSVLPYKIPESIEIDVTGLGMNESIHVGDIELDEEVEVLLDLERTIATVVAPKELVVEEEEEEELEVALVGEEAEEVPEGEVPEGEEAAAEGGEEEAPSE